MQMNHQVTQNQTAALEFFCEGKRNWRPQEVHLLSGSRWASETEPELHWDVTLSLATGGPGTSGRAASAQRGFGRICGAGGGWVISADVLASPVHSSRNPFPLTVALLTGICKQPHGRPGVSLTYASSSPRA